MWAHAASRGAGRLARRAAPAVALRARRGGRRRRAPLLPPCAAAAAATQAAAEPTEGAQVRTLLPRTRHGRAPGPAASSLARGTRRRRAPGVGWGGKGHCICRWQDCHAPLRRAARGVGRSPQGLRCLAGARARNRVLTCWCLPHSPQLQPERTRSAQEDVEAAFSAALAAAFPAVAPTPAPAVAPCNDAKFGDFQCNNAMGLFKRVQAAAKAAQEQTGEGGEGEAQQEAPRSPRDVAQSILDALPSTALGGEQALLAEASIAGPGFINVRLGDEYVRGRVASVVANGAGELAPVAPAGVSRAVVDFSSPNIAKEMHVGHLRSTIIGDSLSRLLEFAGVEVVRLNHVGDWGTQFGMLIQHLREGAGGEAEEGAEGGDMSVAELMALYKEAKARFDAEDDFKARARDAVVALQAGDETSLQAWQRICATSRKEFDAIYAQLGIEGLTERGESFYNPMLKETVQTLTDAGLVVESDGAQCIFSEDKPDGPPLIVRKSDGGFNYASTDLAAVRHRVEAERADWVIYVTDSGQNLHFKGVFDAARRAGFLERSDGDGDGLAPVRLDHCGFGLVLGEDGKRFRTRSTEVVRLADLLDEAKSRCLAQFEERGEASAVQGADAEAAAEAMGYGAVKYADLKNKKEGNYTFSFDRMLDLKGNTAVYLLYAHARVCSIVRKSGRTLEEVRALPAEALKVTEPTERALALHLLKFQDVAAEALNELAMNRITDYLYELASAFTDFYGECKVVTGEKATEDSRLMLCAATLVVMRQCFDLLGIEALERL